MDEANFHSAPEPGTEMDTLLLAGVQIPDTVLEQLNNESFQPLCSDDENTGPREETIDVQQPCDDGAEPAIPLADVQNTNTTQEPNHASYQLFCSDDEEGYPRRETAGVQQPCEAGAEFAALLTAMQNTDSTQESNDAPCQRVTLGNEETSHLEDTAGGMQQPRDAGEEQKDSKRRAPAKPRRKPRRGITKREKKDNAATAFESFKNGRKRKSNATGTGKNATAAKRGKQNHNGRQNVNIDSLLSGSNTVALAKASAAKAAAPGFTVKNKQKAVNEMIQKVPDLDRSAATTDRRSVMDAIQRFNKKPRADGDSGWLHPDMNTGLYNYQLLGVAFMREREKSSAAPHGGFLCDQMGFGKTIQAIANIVDGQAEPDEERKTTLIVVPSHLATHWEREMKMHVKEGASGMTVTHHASNRIDDGLLQNLIDRTILGVLITSYAEVRRSCPDLTQSLDSNNQNESQVWMDHFYRDCGILHRIPFRRIVLDEAHEIKKHTSKTSIAVRTLSARFRWVVTGTPVHNGVEEFFSYFDFLKVPHTGTFQKFRKDYCPDNAPDRSRLNQTLSTYMLRRTFGDEMFGHPILKLPDVDEQNVTVRFSKAERYLYREITVRCVEELFDIANERQESGRVFRCYLVLLLRLRMFTSHLLSSHQTLKKILTPEIVRDLRATVTEDDDPEDLETCHLVKKLVTGQKLPSFEELYDTHPTDKRWEPIPYSTRQRALVTRFRAKLCSGDSVERESEVREMLTCKTCRKSPFDAYITACMHVLCHPCFLNLNKGKSEIKCGCGTLFQKIHDVAFYHTVESLRGPGPVNTGEETAVEAPRLATGYNIEQAETDWVDDAGHLMQGAKLKAIRACVVDWFKKSPDAKVIIFTQFLDMTHILSCLCEHEGWGYVTLTGKSSLGTREADIAQFGNDPDTRIMISSLKTGGTGLNLTMATRCILVDLWWNEAVEQQAFCRMYRIGQTKGVQFVRVTVEDSIDDRLQPIQNSKTNAIDEVMGPEVLSPRETLMNVLQVCGMREDENAEKGFSFLSDDEKPSEN